jgi:hypothetical protein
MNSRTAVSARPAFGFFSRIRVFQGIRPFKDPFPFFKDSSFKDSFFQGIDFKDFASPRKDFSRIRFPRTSSSASPNESLSVMRKPEIQGFVFIEFFKTKDSFSRPPDESLKSSLGKTNPLKAESLKEKNEALFPRTSFSRIFFSRIRVSPRIRFSRTLVFQGFVLAAESSKSNPWKFESLETEFL